MTKKKTIRIDKDSYGTIVAAWALCLALIVLVLRLVGSYWVSVPAVVAAVVFMLFITWFFRVPDRAPVQGEPGLVTAVADGKVVIVEKAFENEYLHRECIQVSIYMNFFDVHANFWPVGGEVSYYAYHPGAKKLAFLPKASELNEHSSSAIRLDDGKEVFFKQIAGTFARRIVCYSSDGLKVERGRQCGVIKFGSRIDIFLPLDASVMVRVGDKVKAVTSVIAEL